METTYNVHCNFLGELFVRLFSYADESGTGGLDPCVCAYVAPAEFWVKFCESWGAVLAAYQADYFHFRELNKSERAREKKQNQYKGWSDERVDDFIHDLAMIIGRGNMPIPFGGGVRLRDPDEPKLVKHLYDVAFEKFLNDFENAMDEHWPGFNGPVTFYFERNSNPDWLSALETAISSRRKKDARIGEIAFSDRRDSVHGKPLQAADMFAYASRQGYERLFKEKQLQPHRILDLILCRNLRPKGHPYYFGEINPVIWELLINEFRAHKKIVDTTNFIMGSPKQPYYPLIHHPYFQQANAAQTLETECQFEQFRKFTK